MKGEYCVEIMIVTPLCRVITIQYSIGKTIYTVKVLLHMVIYSIATASRKYL